MATVQISLGTFQRRPGVHLPFKCSLLLSSLALIFSFSISTVTMCVCVVCLSEGSHVTLLSALLPFLMGAFLVLRNSADDCALIEAHRTRFSEHIRFSFASFFAFL